MDLGGLEVILEAYGFCGTCLLGRRYHESIKTAGEPDVFKPFGIDVRSETRGKIYFAATGRKLWGKAKPVYHALLDHVTFAGPSIEPVWTDRDKRAVVAWHTDGTKKMLLVGLDVEEEIVRHRQGDPEKVLTASVKSMGEFAFERPYYLFEDQLLPEYRSYPWADNLGFLLVEAFSRLTGYPIIEVLPHGAKGLVILIGDDDQAYLAKYQEQLELIDGLPITYFLTPQTRHTPQTLSQLPANVEIGLHPDALDAPDEYDARCAEQAKQIRRLSGRPVRIVRNHGALSRDYLGHLAAWEDNGLVLDANYSGRDGIALTGSFLPMRLRRADGSWSDHYSLLMTFGDGMIFAFGLSQRQTRKRIRSFVRQIESGHPGVLMFNWHPQNIDDTRELHKEVLTLSRRPGWSAIGLETYLDWVLMLAGITLHDDGEAVVLESEAHVKGLVLRYPSGQGWVKVALPPWRGRTVLDRPSVLPAAQTP